MAMLTQPVAMPSELATYMACALPIPLAAVLLSVSAIAIIMMVLGTVRQLKMVVLFRV
jgi:hypothetical protein